MLRVDKTTYLPFFPKSVLSVRLWIRRFTIFRTYKYSKHFCNIPLLNSLTF